MDTSESSPDFDLEAFNRSFRPKLPSKPDPENQGAADNRQRAEEQMRALNR